MLREVLRVQEARGRIPICVRMHPHTKKEMENEMRARKSFDLENSSGHDYQPDNAGG